MGATLNIILPPPEGSLPLFKPEGALQFGRKQFMTIGDHRPLVTFPAYQDGTTKTVNMGIKPPTYGPQLAFNSTNALNLPGSTDLYVVYAFFSTARQTYSQISAVSHITTAGTAKQLVVSGFQPPRDGAIESEIDTIVVGIQMGTSSSFLALWGVTTIRRNDYYIPAASITIDIDADALGQGFDLGQASLYSMVPPAVRYLAKFGNRAWLGGQIPKRSIFSTINVTKAWRTDCAGSGTPSVAGTTTLYVLNISAIEIGDVFTLNLGFTASPDASEWNIVLSTTAASGPTPAFITTLFPLTYGHTGATVTRTHRGIAAARIDCAGIASDTYLWMNFFANGQGLGTIFDVEDSAMWLANDVSVNVGDTTVWHVEGNNDRIWPTSWHNFTPGGEATTFPESINVLDARLLSPVIDGSETFIGLDSDQDSLFIVFDKTVSVMTGTDTVNTPSALLRTDFGSVGGTAAGTICQDDTTSLFWVSQNGFAAGQPGGVRPISADLGLLQFFRDPRWLAPADLVSMQSAFSRLESGFILGNFTINGQANWWGLLSQQPQKGLWLFTGQAMMGNILIYPDSNGQDVILCGDAFEGRTKRLLDPNSNMQDVPSILKHPESFVVGDVSPALTGLKGYTTDGIFHYVMRTASLEKRYVDADWTVAATNSSPAGTGLANTFSDGCYYGGRLYFAAFNNISNKSYLNVYDAGDLSFISSTDLSAHFSTLSGQATSVTTDGTYLYILSWNDNAIRKYNLSDLSYVSSVTISPGIGNASGIYLRDGVFYVMSENVGAIASVTLAGTSTALYTPTDSIDSIGLDFSQQQLRMGRGGFVQYFDGYPYGGDTPEDYDDCFWLGGFQNDGTGLPWTPSYFRFAGANVPARSTLSAVPVVWQDDFPNRDEDELESGFETELGAVDLVNFNEDIPAPPKARRYLAYGLRWTASAGAAPGARGMEPTDIRIGLPQEGP